MPLLLTSLRRVGQADSILCNLAEPLYFPSVLHSSPRMVCSTSALSASSAAISSMISSGLRCVTSSPPLGFFTERSNVVLSMLLASTLHDLGESANVFCSVDELRQGRHR